MHFLNSVKDGEWFILKGFVEDGKTNQVLV